MNQPRHLIHRMAVDLADAGIVGVALGGSRARGDALEASDWDLGLYYRGSYDPRHLTALAQRWSGPDAVVGAPGSWGPWVNAGAWLSVDGVAVDWILRDLDQVALQAERARAGTYAFHRQVGHPYGFLDVSYAGELALSEIVADPTGELAGLRSRCATNPAALTAAFEQGLWEAGFMVASAQKGLARGDSVYVASCLAHCVFTCAHTVMARVGQWVTNEKGLVPAATAVDPGFGGFAHRITSRLGSDPTRAVAAARSLVEAMSRS